MTQNLDFLKAALGDELLAQVSEKLKGADNISLVNLSDGNYIPKAKFDEERQAGKAYKAQIEELNGKLGELQALAQDNESLKSQIQQLQDNLQKQGEEMQQQRLQYSIRDAVREKGARNAELVMRMIDPGKISEKNGQLLGLAEQIEALKKSDGYLFRTEQDQGGVDPHREPDGHNGTNFAVNEMIRRAAGR